MTTPISIYRYTVPFKIHELVVTPKLRMKCSYCFKVVMINMMGVLR